MEYKKLNSALLLTVIALFVTTILVLIKVLFSGAKGFEWGSVSDWFSSLSTFGTLVIAWFAYKEAPGWISQKNYEHVHNMILDLIYSDLQKVLRSSFKYQTNLYSFFRLVANTINENNKDQSLVIKKKLELDDFYENLSDIMHLTIRKSKTINRYGWELSTEAEFIFNEIKKAVSEYTEIHSNNVEKLFNFNMHIDTPNNGHILINDTQESVRHLRERIKNLIHEIDVKNHPVEYFAHPKKKHRII